jgi:hypothetical protein
MTGSKRARKPDPSLPLPPPPFPPFRPHRSERHELFSDLSLPLPVSISAVQVTPPSIGPLVFALCFAPPCRPLGVTA